MEGQDYLVDARYDQEPGILRTTLCDSRALLSEAAGDLGCRRVEGSPVGWVGWATDQHPLPERFASLSRLIR
jgi:hypothetical protein